MGRSHGPQGGENNDRTSRQQSEEKQAADPARLTPSQLAAILTKSGEVKVTESDIQESIASGLPTNQDGTVSLITFVAWVETQVRRSRRV